MLIAPRLEQRVIQNMLARAVAPDHREIVHRLDARTDAREQARRARRSLSQQHGIARAMLPDLLLNGLRKLLDKVALHILLALKARERPLLRRVVRRSLVSGVANRRVDLLDHRKRLVAAIGDLHLNQRVRQAHRAQSRAPGPQLRLRVLRDKYSVASTTLSRKRIATFVFAASRS